MAVQVDENVALDGLPDNWDINIVDFNLSFRGGLNPIRGSFTAFTTAKPEVLPDFVLVIDGIGYNVSVSSMEIVPVVNGYSLSCEFEEKDFVKVMEKQIAVSFNNATVQDVVDYLIINLGIDAWDLLDSSQYTWHKQTVLIPDIDPADVTLDYTPVNNEVYFYMDGVEYTPTYSVSGTTLSISGSSALKGNTAVLYYQISYEPVNSITIAYSGKTKGFLEELQKLIGCDFNLF